MSDSIRWVTYNCIEDWSSCSKHRNHHILREYLRECHSIVSEVCENVISRFFFRFLYFCIFLYLFNNLLIVCFSSDTKSSEHPLVKITTEYKRSELWTRQSDTTTSNKGVIDEITRLDLCLIRHEKCKLMISWCRPKVWSLLKIILCEERLPVRVPCCGHLSTENDLIITSIINQVKN